MTWTKQLPYLCKIKDTDYFAIIRHIAEDRTYEVEKEYSYFAPFWKIGRLEPIDSLKNILETHYPETLL